LNVTGGGPGSKVLGGAVSVPPQVFKVTAFCRVIRSPPGKESMKLSPDRGTGALLVIVKMTATLPPAVAWLGLNSLVKVGGRTGFTVRLTGALRAAGAWLLVSVVAGFV